MNNIVPGIVLNSLQISHQFHWKTFRQVLSSFTHEEFDSTRSVHKVAKILAYVAEQNLSPSYVIPDHMLFTAMPVYNRYS